jgi:hypothetical protein
VRDVADLFARKLLLAVLVVLLAASAVLTWQVASWDHPEAVVPEVLADGQYRAGTMADDETQAALEAAVDILPTALAYDYRTLDKGLEAATSRMTTSFAASFTSTFDKTTRRMAVEKKAVTHALVRAAGVVGEAHDGKALVLVYLDQVLVSSRTRKASDPLKVSQNRVHVRLERVDGAWRVSDIAPF